MHLIVPFAGVMSETGRAAVRELALPRLAAALACMDLERLPLPAGADPDAPELSLTPPHEHVRARALGLPVTDGQLPWAALEAARAGLPWAGRAWGRLTPAHWQLGTEQLTMLDPQVLALDAASAAAFLAAVRPLFEDEGFAVHAGCGADWLVAHPSLADMPCASLDRVVGRNVDRWLPADPRARLLRRLQSEVQMLLHGHPLNEAREEQGALAVNSFWLDGCGMAPPPVTASPSSPTSIASITAPTLDGRLRAPALDEDWSAWREAFLQLDAGPLAQALQAARAGQPVCLSLCGERHAVTLTARPRTVWQRLRAGVRRPSLRAVRHLLDSL